jgi:hypothetical protein
MSTKKIAGYPDYSATNDGKIISYRNSADGRELSPSTTNGYEKVCLHDRAGNKKNFQLHRLIAMAFIKRKRGCNIVNHIDGNKMNNAVSNLEWTTRRGNAQHYEKHIAPKNRVNRQQKKNDDMIARLAMIKFARNNCGDNIELFLTTVDAQLTGLSI